ncbi:MAG: tRNA epoxyqueuosine(34) reductase QueG [Spirochaeta sp. LUC14_002_19_P3]|nr:MAG: tRNA epoxyqueuosine(34) reductase QueG [Spirochaeta sp. LUC14_002_19_P3]
MNTVFQNIAKLYHEEELNTPAYMEWPPDNFVSELIEEQEELFMDRVSAGMPPGLAWMERHASVKYHPDRVLSGCRSVLVSSLGYYRDDSADHAPPGVLRGRIARYARGRDYHKELGRRLKRIADKLRGLFPSEQFMSFTDTGPLDEVWLAAASGAGFRGRHGLAILPGTGSWAVLGHLLSTARLGSSPVRPSPMRCPDGCRRCIDACPTGALTMPLNPSLCISYQSIEHRGAVDEALRGDTGNWVFGCDVCQEVCPFNARAEETTVRAFQRDYAGASVDLIELLKLKNHEETVRRFAGSPLMRAGRNGLVRNACTVIGNIGNREFLPELEKLFTDGDAAVREHARWAHSRIAERTGAGNDACCFQNPT